MEWQGPILLETGRDEWELLAKVRVPREKKRVAGTGNANADLAVGAECDRSSLVRMGNYGRIVGWVGFYRVIRR
jgi:hypothetical protein